jgi:hypothetical protein
LVGMLRNWKIPTFMLSSKISNLWKKACDDDDDDLKDFLFQKSPIGGMKGFWLACKNPHKCVHLDRSCMPLQIPFASKKFWWWGFRICVSSPHPPPPKKSKGCLSLAI